MQIVHLSGEDKEKIEEVAHLLLEDFTEAWNDIEECLCDVEETVQNE